MTAQLSWHCAMCKMSHWSHHYNLDESKMNFTGNTMQRIIHEMGPTTGNVCLFEATYCISVCSQPQRLILMRAATKWRALVCNSLRSTVMGWWTVGVIIPWHGLHHVLLRLQMKPSRHVTHQCNYYVKAMLWCRFDVIMTFLSWQLPKVLLEMHQCLQHGCSVPMLPCNTWEGWAD